MKSIDLMYQTLLADTDQPAKMPALGGARADALRFPDFLSTERNQANKDVRQAA